MQPKLQKSARQQREAAPGHFATLGTIGPVNRWYGKRVSGAQTREERIMNRLGDFATAIGNGLFAGAFGTAAMTPSSTAEMLLRVREASGEAPAQAAVQALLHGM